MLPEGFNGSTEILKYGTLKNSIGFKISSWVFSLAWVTVAN